MLRIHFGAEDLVRTTLSSEPDPLWEVLLSLHMLQVHDGPVPYGAWRERMHRKLPRGTVDPLLTLAPPVGYSPDFLTPSSHLTDFDDAVDQILSTPRRRIRTDLSRLTTTRPTTDLEWVKELAGGRPDSLRRLGDSIHLYHRTALAPYWPSLRAAVQADNRVRSQQLSSGGMAAILESIHPQARWQNHILEIPSLPNDDLRLGGRGLRLQPSYFCWNNPTKLMDDELPPVLVFPIDEVRGLERADRITGGTTQERLAALLGQTRATVLAMTVAGSTTTQLAHACNITLARASHQTSVLREAGLITSHRQGKFVTHRATRLGRQLLEAGDLDGKSQAISESRPQTRLEQGQHRAFTPR